MRTFIQFAMALLCTFHVATAWGSEVAEVDAVVRSMPEGTTKRNLTAAIETLTVECTVEHPILRVESERAQIQLFESKNETLAKFAISMGPPCWIEYIEKKRKWTAFEIKRIALSTLEQSVTDAPVYSYEMEVGHAKYTSRLSSVLVKAFASRGLDIGGIKREGLTRGVTAQWLTKVADAAINDKSQNQSIRFNMMAVKQITKDIPFIKTVVSEG